ncbi:glycosyltransferase [Mucilaginibacter sp.]|uniref:glycosyltransferase family 2 protein n=1 Tax=Mucilaginibacter sp. TaxID=1882438 RepID=UPI00283AD5A5|nr:glycosyltransferase [Mucilaginibacter sp.]MDR3697541.1 glycosyltransferase [Mucilaginibacter sp.]
MQVGILVTNYNTWDLTSKCIENCLNYADTFIDQFVVVDDCSTVQFENQFKQITLIKNPANAGLAHSLNKGIFTLNTELIFIFDSDAWPLENFIIKTQQYFFSNPKIGIATFETENLSGKRSASYETEPGAISLVLGQQLYSRYQKYFTRRTSDITVYTCAMVIRKKVIEQVGGFDENYDWLELDHDICMSAKRKGWEIGVMPLRAFHKGSGTAQEVSERVIRYYENRLKLLRKFNKYPVGKLLNTLIIIRLSFEYFAINTIGRIKYNKKTIADKSFSRSSLVKRFLNGSI